MRWLSVAVAVVLATVSSWAQVPRVLSYQGILTDRDGRILPDGDYELQIRLYDRLDATEPIYVERQRVTSQHGVVNVLIGTVEPLPEHLTFDRVYYVGVSVNGSEELQPRTMLTAVPYALRAESAATAWALTGNSITSAWNGMSGSFLGTTNTQPLVFARTNITPLQPLQVLWVGNQGTFCFNPLASSAPVWRIQRGGGNKRGLHAVDLQSERSAATQVASGNYSVIGGGRDNTASGGGATVGGGMENTARGVVATVGGGYQNTARGDAATVGGGVNNTASGVGATVGGGGGNTASDTSATVGGGEQNTARGYAATVGGGRLNTARGNDATIGGGYQNTARGSDATVGGGYQNTARGDAATVGGGEQNTARGSNATVGGGRKNTARGSNATVGGGVENTASDVAATVSGGVQNTASGDFATVGGGVQNTASGWAAIVGGGGISTASGGAATVGGGSNNTASGLAATVGGGSRDTASGFAATVGGGVQNTASGDFATVGGGRENTASGDFSVVTGGASNTANGDYNFVFGENVDPSVTETHRVYFFGDGTSSNPSGFLVINRLDGDYPIHVGTDSTNGNGAHLTAGGAWTNGSSRSFKERFVQYRPAEVLEKIRQLPVEGYFYKGTEEYHITPMAEDFYRLFGTGVHEIIETDSTGQLVRRPNPEVDKYLAASDVAGVALLGVKALDERMSTLGPQNSALEQRLEALQQENQRLRQQLEQVMERLALVEAQLQQGGSTAGENAWLGRAFRTRPTARQ